MNIFFVFCLEMLGDVGRSFLRKPFGDEIHFYCRNFWPRAKQPSNPDSPTTRKDGRLKKRSLTLKFFRSGWILIGIFETLQVWVEQPVDLGYIFFVQTYFPGTNIEYNINGVGNQVFIQWNPKDLLQKHLLYHFGRGWTAVILANFATIFWIHSGKLTVAMENGPEIKLYLLLKTGDIPASYVSWPEGTPNFQAVIFSHHEKIPWNNQGGGKKFPGRFPPPPKHHRGVWPPGISERCQAVGVS